MMTVRFGENDLRQQLGRTIVKRGSALWRRDRVRLVEDSAEGTRITGSVSDGRPRPFSQTIMLAPHGKTVHIKGYCTCLVGLNCEHVAAVLVAHLMNGGRRATIERPSDEARVREQSLSATQKENTTAARAPRLALSAPVSGWLDRLAFAIAPPSAKVRAGRTKRRLLLFVLNHARGLVVRDPDSISMRPVSVRPCQDGTIGDERPFELEDVLRTNTRVQDLVGADLDLLRDLAWLQRIKGRHGGVDIQLDADAAGLRILQTVLATGRLRHGTPHGPVLNAGPEVPAEARWIKLGHGQKLSFAPLAPTTAAPGVETGPCSVSFDLILALDPPHYVDLRAGQVGTIKTELPPAMAVEVARAPSMTAAEATLVKQLWQEEREAAPKPSRRGAPCCLTPTDLLPMPEAPDAVETCVVTPIPRLDLIVGQAHLKPDSIPDGDEWDHRGALALPLARLSFDYGGEIVPADAPARTLERLEANRLILKPRDLNTEAKAAQRLAELGLRPLAGLPFAVEPQHANALFIAARGARGAREIIASVDNPQRFITFSADAVPELIREGWQVAYSDDYPYRLADEEAQWWADIGESSGIEWFSFELGVEFENHRINLVPVLAQMLCELPQELLERVFLTGGDADFARLWAGYKIYHPLPDGRLLPLSGARLAPMLKALLELIGPRGERLDDGRVTLHRAEVGALAAFAGEAGLKLAWAASAERLLALGESLRGGHRLKAPTPPAWFRAELRSYQRAGFAWLDFLRDAGFGGVLADDMGLGKTVQALAFLAHEKHAGRLDKPALIVCPTSVLPNWVSEAERFAPKLAVLPLRGLDRKELFGKIPHSDLVLTTYPLLARDQEVLLTREYHVAILDEAQVIKNPKATVSGVAHRINARHRLALTGTPLENHLGEVWSLFAFVSPGLLGDEATFRRTFRLPIEKRGDATVQAFLSRRLKPFMLRRTKEEVATELPPKTEINERVRLEGAQRELYETVRTLMHKRVRQEIATRGLAKSRIVFLDALLKLRQVCCDPRLLQMAQARRVKGSAKLERLMEMIPQLLEEGRRILVFSQFTRMLALIEEELTKLGIPYAQLTGETVDRATPCRQFQAGKVPLFLLSLKAGGTGLNLTAADTVIHYDPWWNPAVENQATDRAHRIGQDKPVFVYKLIVDEGVEVAIEQLKVRKAALAEALFAGLAKTPLDLSEADISALFAPLDPVPERRVA
jgi:superfamily II DNA or RNA helicase